MLMVPIWQTETKKSLSFQPFPQFESTYDLQPGLDRQN